MNLHVSVFTYLRINTHDSLIAGLRTIKLNEFDILLVGLHQIE